MENLIALLNNKSQELNGYDLSEDFLDCLFSVYPFNRFEYVISHLLATDVMTLEEYLNMRQDYISRNKYLHLYELAPRTFGETWGQNHITELVSELEAPSPRLDPDYSGQYDLWFNGIRIEVKASRAARREGGKPLIEKALASSSPSGFDMNFQQIKPKCCDVFIWIGVWRDTIKYWVLSSYEVSNNTYYSVGQHRGNVGEGQLWIKDTNIKDFERYSCSARDLLTQIIEKGSDNQKGTVYFIENPPLN